MLELDTELIRRYDVAGPRYTSYPTTREFQDYFGEDEYRTCARRSNDDLIPKPLSLYVHIPFCDTVCFYCACNKVVTKDRSRAAPYLERLHQEIAFQGALFDRDRMVDQLHWGGGTPTFLNHDQMRELMRVAGEYFTLRNDDSGEYSIEVDPRGIGEDTIRLLRELGFNRLSMGVQDFDPKVQEAVNRIQSEEQTLAVLNAARRHDFKSVGMDLIYGLPFQDVGTFGRTLDKVIAAGPDRLSVFNYAHLPGRFKPQQRINAADIPTPAEKLAILQLTVERLGDAGYVYIGMDHFARPDDELAQAQRAGTLQRNFQGYSTHADCDLVGIGVSAISKVADSYSQNLRELDAYYHHIDAGKLPVMRGIELEPEDVLRGEIIMQLICHFRVDIRGMENRWRMCFKSFFDAEQPKLRAMEEDRLIVQDEDAIEVLPAGRLLVRNICTVFDRYQREKRRRGKGFSRVI